MNLTHEFYDSQIGQFIFDDPLKFLLDIIIGLILGLIVIYFCEKRRRIR